MAQPLTRFRAVSSGEKLIPLPETANGSLRWPDILARIPEGLVLEVSVSEWQESRSLRQNAYLHAIIEWWRKQQADRNGNVWSPEHAKEMLKRWVGWYDTIQVTGKDGKSRSLKITRSTHNLSKQDFTDLIRLIADRVADDWPDAQIPHYDP